MWFMLIYSAQTDGNFNTDFTFLDSSFTLFMDINFCGP